MSQPASQKMMTPVDKLLSELGVFTVHDQRLEERNQKLVGGYKLFSSTINIDRYQQRWYAALKKRQAVASNPTKKRGPGRPTKLNKQSTPIEDHILSPIDVVLLMEQKMNQFDQLIREVSVPWGRAADTKWFADAIRAWEMLLAVGAYDMINGVKNILVHKNTMTEWDVVKKLQGWLQVEVFPYGKMIMDVAWRERDVSPSFALTLNRPPAPVPEQGYTGKGTPYEASLGRQSDTSKTFAFPGDMDTRVRRQEGRG